MEIEEETAMKSTERRMNSTAAAAARVMQQNLKYGHQNADEARLESYSKLKFKTRLNVEGR